MGFPVSYTRIIPCENDLGIPHSDPSHFLLPFDWTVTYPADSPLYAPPSGPVNYKNLETFPNAELLAITKFEKISEYDKIALEFASETLYSIFNSANAPL